ncbi:MAG TPA: metallophosphoesterase [Nocardioides sp.]|uniref:metallophosphoesterase n=1 Tax=uncultured Nocardioides sp. TaxID=198441 RepID=UPI000EC74107|nr:metallophosphoesterase [uncultured Nocardioides sp.]HCB06743.1 phosphodiesterase [Nocardioides sp.]HRD61099.1 metallophosphoesterase [Nocardioides sp.]HRI96266.1 metallophosphoesterase [Nocardioides sp.]HRK45760.1 metallophosphoesterase [Nocardioides sp.]
MQYGQYPLPRFTVAHLSDVHLLANDVLQYGVVEPEAGLRLALERLRRLDPVPQALVFTGDLADRGEPDAYARLRELVEPLALEIGAQVVWVMGNHDARAPYAKGLFDSDDDGPQDRVHDLGGLRIIALDTSVPEYHHGELSTDQLDWLRDQLATPAEHGTILAMHHPPIPVPTLEPAAIIELLDQHLLAEVIAGTDVRAILGGHFHYSSHATFAGVPVSVASASCYTTDPAPAGRLISGVDGHQAFNTVHVYDDRIVHTVIPIPEAPEVSGQPDEMRALLDALSPEERREIISRKDSDFNTQGESHEQHNENPLTEL